MVLVAGGFASYQTGFSNSSADIFDPATNNYTVAVTGGSSSSSGSSGGITVNGTPTVLINGIAVSYDDTVTVNGL